MDSTYIVGYKDFFMRISPENRHLFFEIMINDENVVNSKNDTFILSKKYALQNFNNAINYGIIYIRSDTILYISKYFIKGSLIYYNSFSNTEYLNIRKQWIFENTIYDYYSANIEKEYDVYKWRKGEYQKYSNFNKDKDIFYYDYKTKKGGFYNKNNEVLCSFIFKDNKIKYIKKNKKYKIFKKELGEETRISYPIPLTRGDNSSSCITLRKKL